jgi:hypothetical protein
MAEGWLWLSMRMATAMPSPASMTPAFSPGPTSTCGASVGSRLRWIRDDLYEQCSLHMTANRASSRWFGERPRMVSSSSRSPSVSPRARWSGWSEPACPGLDAPCASDPWFAPACITPSVPVARLPPDVPRRRPGHCQVESRLEVRHQRHPPTHSVLHCPIIDLLVPALRRQFRLRIYPNAHHSTVPYPTGSDSPLQLPAWWRDRSRYIDESHGHFRT